MSESLEEVRFGGRGGRGRFGGLAHSSFLVTPGVLEDISSCPSPDSRTAWDCTGGGGGGISPSIEPVSRLSSSSAHI